MDWEDRLGWLLLALVVVLLLLSALECTLLVVRLT